MDLASACWNNPAAMVTTTMTITDPPRKSTGMAGKTLHMTTTIMAVAIRRCP